MERKNYRKMIDRKKLKKRVLIFLVLPLFLLGTSTVVYATYLYKQAQSAVNKSYDDLNRNQSDIRDQMVDPATDDVSILFLGVDSSDSRESQGMTSDNSRTDAMVLATLNNEKKSVNLVSIPRDTLTYIPEVGYEDKIAHAHAFGGPQASMETVESLLDVPVDYYVRMNFNAFIDVVNSLDGVSIDVPFEFFEQDSSDKKDAIHLLPGMQTLDGEEALAFARTRYYDNDIERGKRQVELIEAIMDKSTSATSINKYSSVIQAVGQNLKTNLTFDEMKSFISYAVSSDLSVENLSFQGEDTSIDGIYYYQPDITEIWSLQETLKNHLGLNDTDSTSPSTDNENDVGISQSTQNDW
ncbi:LCP family protein [Jeotgalibacillus marinus]|uniref:LCP family protein n=1 Tax=Jeotgalibacillus marinus TaxID=86667 RepID=A0ABV3Q4J8_9BACL